MCLKINFNLTQSVVFFFLRTFFLILFLIHSFTFIIMFVLLLFQNIFTVFIKHFRVKINKYQTVSKWVKLSFIIYTFIFFMHSQSKWINKGFVNVCLYESRIHSIECLATKAYGYNNIYELHSFIRHRK